MRDVASSPCAWIVHVSQGGQEDVLALVTVVEYEVDLFGVLETGQAWDGEVPPLSVALQHLSRQGLQVEAVGVELGSVEDLIILRDVNEDNLFFAGI